MASEPQPAAPAPASGEQPTKVFQRVWLKTGEGSVKTFGLAWEDRGEVRVFPDRLEFHGKKNAFTLWHIRAVDVGKFGDNPMHKWVRVRSIHEGQVSVVLFSAKGGIL